MISDTQTRIEDIAALTPLAVTQTAVNTANTAFKTVLQAESDRVANTKSNTGDTFQASSGINASDRQNSSAQTGDTQNRATDSSAKQASNNHPSDDHNDPSAKSEMQTTKASAASPAAGQQDNGGTATAGQTEPSAAASMMKDILLNQIDGNQQLLTNLKIEKNALNQMLGSAKSTMQPGAAPSGLKNAALSGKPVAAAPAVVNLDKTNAAEGRKETGTSAADVKENQDGAKKEGKIEPHNGAEVAGLVKDVKAAVAVSQPIVSMQDMPAIKVETISRIGIPVPLLPDDMQLLKDRVLQKVESGIQMLIDQGESRMTLKLYPPELGRVQVELTVDGQRVDAKINTENMAVREVIMANLEQLKGNIEQNGQTLNSISVEIGNFRDERQHTANPSDGDENGGNGKGGKDQGDGAALDDAARQSSLSLYIGHYVNMLI